MRRRFLEVKAIDPSVAPASRRPDGRATPASVLRRKKTFSGERRARRPPDSRRDAGATFGAAAEGGVLGPQ